MVRKSVRYTYTSNFYYLSLLQDVMMKHIPEITQWKFSTIMIAMFKCYMERLQWIFTCGFLCRYSECFLWASPISWTVCGRCDSTSVASFKNVSTVTMLADIALRRQETKASNNRCMRSSIVAFTGIVLTVIQSTLMVLKLKTNHALGHS